MTKHLKTRIGVDPTTKIMPKIYLVEIFIKTAELSFTFYAYMIIKAYLKATHLSRDKELFQKTQLLLKLFFFSKSKILTKIQSLYKH